MTTDEIIAEINNIRKFNYTLAPDEVFDMSIKALKQYGVLQEIRQEIEKPLRDERCYDTADAKAQYIALNWVCEIIDKHIKEIEG